MPSYFHFFKWLLFLWVLSVLSACGGGDESSNLLFEPEQTETDGSTTDTTETTAQDVIFSVEGKQIILPGSNSTVMTLTSFKGDVITILPNVPVTVSITGEATLEGGQQSVDITTDSRGQISFKVSYPNGATGNPRCFVVARSGYEGSITFPLYFGGTANSRITTRETVQANGTDQVGISVTARDGSGIPIADARVEFSFSPADSFAVPAQTTGVTNANGEFSTTVTSTIPQEDVFITPIVSGLATTPLKVNFTPIDAVSTDTAKSLDTFVKANSVLADGKAEAILIIIARDALGAPVKNIAVGITSNSITANLRIGDLTDTLSIQGSTGEEGRLELIITNNVEETVDIAVATTVTDGSTTNTLTNSQAVVFTNAATPSGATVKTIKLDNPINNGQLANGTNSVSLRGVVSDENGNPVAGQAVSILVSGGSAKISSVNAVASEDTTTSGDTVVTDASGRFFAELTDTVVESFSAWAVAGDVKSNTVTVRFSATASGTDNTSRLRITLFAVPEKQQIGEDKAITLSATVRDGNGTPVSGISLLISASGATASTAVFDEGKKPSDGGGNATFTVTNSVAGTFSVVLRAEDEEGNSLGVQSNSQQVEFVMPTTPTPEVVEVELIVTVVKNNQPANGEAAAQIDIIARNTKGSAVEGVPITLQMSSGASAVAKPAKLMTDANGFATTEITSTQAGTIAVVFAVESEQGFSLAESPNPVSITFTAVPASDESLLLKTVEMEVGDPQPADGKSAIAVVVKPLDENNVPIAGANVELIIVSPNVQGERVGTTDALGEFRTFLTSEIAEENIKVTAVVTLNEQTHKDTSKTITFLPLGGDIADLTVSVIGDNQLANNEAFITIVAVTRDNQSRTISNVPIIVTLPQGTQARSAPSRGETDADGVFSTNITSLQAGEIPVTIAIDRPSGLAKTVTITFKSEEADEATVLDQIDLLVENSPQVADGEATISLTAIPFGTKSNGEKTATLSDINIEFIAEPDGLTFTPGVSGKTNALGRYTTTITSERAGIYKITPLAWKEAQNDQEIVKFIDTPTEIEFKPVGNQVKELTVDVVNNNQPVGTAIQIAVVARDERGVGLANIPIAVRIDTQSKASANPARGFTDDNGLFNTEISSTTPGTVAVTIAVEGTEVVHPPVSVTFVAGADVSVARTELTVLNAPQAADGTAEITLLVKAFDERGEPVPGKDVELIADSNRIEIKTLTGPTNALGEFRTTATSTVAGTYQVTPLVDGVRGEVVPVTFVPIEIPIPNTLTLTVTDNNQEIGGEATLTVLARDEGGLPVSGVPVVIRVEPGDEPPDVTGSVIFGGGFKGDTGDNGTFTTTIKNSRAGSFKVRAFVDGTALSSNTEIVTFTVITTETPEVATVELIADPPQLDSEGWKTDSDKAVIITAILRNRDNNLVPKAKVSFTANSGEIQPVTVEGDTVTPAVEAISDDKGRAYARLTTQGNPNNRTITVTATVATTLGDIEGPVRSTIDVEVRGTVLTVTGASSLTLNDTAPLTIELKDSAGNGIRGQTLTAESALGNFIDNTRPVTDMIGQAVVTLTAQVPGQDTITITGAGVAPAILSLSISDDNFVLRTSPQEGVTNISLNQTQAFTVSWSKSGVPQVNQQISLATTRGELSSGSVLTDFNGEAQFTITSGNVGSATVTASVVGGPSAQLSIRFIARPEQADSMVLQATPSTIGVNTGDANEEKQVSDIVAIVRAGSNLVPGLKVNFSLNDPTGGHLSAESKITDDFGRASVQYVSGNVPSSSEGVIVTATVEGVSAMQCSGAVFVPPNGCQVRLTVALKEVFVSLGTGNKVSELDTITYSYPFKVLVTDINGAPVPGARVVLSLWPEYYLKGYYKRPEPAAEGETQEGWEQIITLYQNPANTATNFRCSNEDVNRNGILDPGEDINGNGRLDPGAIATFAPDTQIAGNNSITIETGSSGFGDFNIYYFKENASWSAVTLTARAEVTGSEGTDSTVFELLGMASDYSDPNASPPGVTSPFGLGGRIELDAEGFPVFNGTTATCSDSL